MMAELNVQNIIVGVILAASLYITAFKIYKNLRPKKNAGCSSGCGDCPLKKPCQDA